MKLHFGAEVPEVIYIGSVLSKLILLTSPLVSCYRSSNALENRHPNNSSEKKLLQNVGEHVRCSNRKRRIVEALMQNANQRSVETKDQNAAKRKVRVGLSPWSGFMVIRGL